MQKLSLGKKTDGSLMTENELNISLNDFELMPDTGVFVHPNYSGFNYSDGNETEKKIYRILCSVSDQSIFSQELQSSISDWPTEYHFSSLRHNLLRHFPFSINDDILELGAGCGAITRQLGETRAAVTAVEGSYKRAKCASVRCRDLSNVTVYCSDFRNIVFDKKYDIVTLLGVLEYAPLFFDSTNPLRECLRLARKALKSNGKLIVAIENQLGLKYFCGSPEDHVGQQFFGLEDMYTKSSVKTVGRKELEKTLSKIGFSSIEFLYPFPDYKLPVYLFTEKAFECEGFSPEEIIRQLESRDYSGRYKKLINEMFLWPVVGRNGLIPDLANSFLIVASDTCEDNTCKEDTELAYGYTVNRNPRYNTTTTFAKQKNGNIYIRKPRIANECHLLNDNVLSHHPMVEEYVKGQHLSCEIEKAIHGDDFEAFMSYLRMWISYLTDNGVLCLNSFSIEESIMKPFFIDCIPDNLIISDNGLQTIDMEWSYRKRYTLGALTLRYLERYATNTKCVNFLDRHFPGSSMPLFDLYTAMGMTLNEAIYNEYTVIANLIDSHVYPWRQRREENINVLIEDYRGQRDHIKNLKTNKKSLTGYELVARIAKKALQRVLNWLTNCYAL